MLIDEINNIKSTRSELRKFGLVVGLVLAGIGGIILYTEGLQPSAYLISAGAALIILGLSVPMLLLPIQKVWMAVAVVLGWFMTRVILSILFFLVLTPIGLITRAFGGGFLEMKWREPRHSYWNRRQPQAFEPNQLERQF